MKIQVSPSGNGANITFARFTSHAFSKTLGDERCELYFTPEEIESLREQLPRPAIEKELLDEGVKKLVSRLIEQRIEAELKLAEYRIETEARDRRLDEWRHATGQLADTAEDLLMNCESSKPRREAVGAALQRIAPWRAKR